MDPDQEFSRRLTETDAYLQLIIGQLKDLDEKIEEAATSDCEEEKRRLVEIKVETLTLLDRVKHTIVLLQIAKNTLNGSLNVQPSLTQPAGGSSLRHTSGSVVDKTPPTQQPAQKQQSHFKSQQAKQRGCQSELKATATSPTAASSSFSPRGTFATSTSTSPSASSHPPPPSSSSSSISCSSTAFSSSQNCISNRTVSTDEITNSTSVGVGYKNHSPYQDLADSIRVKGTQGASNSTSDKLTRHIDNPEDLDEDVSIGVPVIPETYSSSDEGDDDDYYDATEFSAQGFPVIGPGASPNSALSTMPRRKSTTSTSSLSSSGQGKFATPTTSVVQEEIDTSHINSRSNSSPSSSKLSPSYDYDALYDDDEEELGSLENHGSVISHLISQVKIGMDLTKVVLPTFILERRSLLEMYADFFAHPDLFIAIADGTTPEIRFISVVRWYLSAFHAGRKSSVAKKPYNPVLGEVFKCSWDIPGYEHYSNSSNSNININSTNLADKNGTSATSPLVVSSSGADEQVTIAKEATTSDEERSINPVVNSASPGNLTFIAEQVSHHPPISAFYAEHPEKQIQCTGFIYTKSAFLGLSIGVHNIGKGSIYLLKYGEEYTVTFPSAYGRSILTVPWIELGGSVTITCQQTGYSANVNFLTKPFYGGKRHKISCEVNSPTKRNFLTISGEWNGTIKAKWPATGQEEVFVDTKSIPIIKKKVAPILTQEEYESRRLWKNLTLALKIGDVDLATSTKSKIEQRQRDLVKERQESRITWQRRAFHQLGDNWFYNNPLSKRVREKQ